MSVILAKPSVKPLQQIPSQRLTCVPITALSLNVNANSVGNTILFDVADVYATKLVITLTDRTNYQTRELFISNGPSLLYTTYGITGYLFNLSVDIHSVGTNCTLTITNNENTDITCNVSMLPIPTDTFIPSDVLNFQFNNTIVLPNSLSFVDYFTEFVIGSRWTLLISDGLNVQSIDAISAPNYIVTYGSTGYLFNVDFQLLTYGSVNSVAVQNNSSVPLTIETTKIITTPNHVVDTCPLTKTSPSTISVLANSSSIIHSLDNAEYLINCDCDLGYSSVIVKTTPTSYIMYASLGAIPGITITTISGNLVIKNNTSSDVIVNYTRTPLWI